MRDIPDSNFQPTKRKKKIQKKESDKEKGVQINSKKAYEAFKKSEYKDKYKSLTDQETERLIMLKRQADKAKKMLEEKSKNESKMEIENEEKGNGLTAIEKMNQDLEKEYIKAEAEALLSKKSRVKGRQGIKDNNLSLSGKNKYKSSKINLSVQDNRFMEIKEKDREDLVNEMKELAYFESHSVECEWWDQAYIANKNRLREFLTNVNSIKQERIDEEFIQEPETTLIMYPTEEEKKKNKKKKKMEKQREEQEKIKYGLLPAPEDKLRLKNLPKLMEANPDANPTLLEKQIRDQMEKRKKDHEEHNEKRRLTKDKKIEKVLRKVKRDVSKGIRLVFLVVNGQISFKDQFKLKNFVEKYYIHGFRINLDKVNIFAIESGYGYSNKLIKQIRKYTTKNEEEKGEDNLSALLGSLGIVTHENKKETVEILWEGKLEDHKIKRWTNLNPKTDKDVRDLFLSNQLEDYIPFVFNRLKHK